MRNRSFVWVAAASMLLVAEQASASGYLAARFGADDGTPAVANPYALYFNPAAMGGMKGTTLAVDGTLVLRDVSYTRPQSALSSTYPDANTNAQYIAANTGKASLSNIAVLPFAGVASDLGGSDFRLGFATYVPFGGSAKWDKTASNGVPGAEDGPQRWHNIEGSITALYNTLGLAYVLPGGKLSIGGSVSGVVHSIHTVRARNADSSDTTANLTGGTSEGRATLDASGFNIGAALGVYWAPNPDLTVGLSYTSQPGFGETRMNGTLQTALPGVQPTTADIDFLQTYPDIIRLGATYRVSKKTQLRVDGSFTRWSVFKDQCVVVAGKDCTLKENGADASGGANIVANIPRRWQNSVGARVGVVHDLNESWALHASTAISTSAVPKSTEDASTIDAFRVYGTLGAFWKLDNHLRFGLNYTHIYFAPVTVGAADAKQYTWVGASKQPSAAGDYKSSVNMFDANIAYTF